MLINLRTCSISAEDVEYIEGMRQMYPSDISREQFEPIRTLLENARKKARPRRGLV
jgi:hypothetical protein